MERCSISYPCVACKIRRRKCGEKCLLAPYFPPEDPHKFLTAHKVFGTKYIVKILRDVPAEKRKDAVSSMVYEACARLKDPVYGCTGLVCQLQKQELHLQSQLATMQAEIVNTQANCVSLMAKSYNTVETVCTSDVPHNIFEENDANSDDMIVFEDLADPFSLWEPLEK